MYGCEFCPSWIHATCLFPNAPDSKLKILFEYHSGFCVRCRECKQASKERTSQLVTKEDIKQLADTIKQQSNLSHINKELTKCVPDLVNKVAKEYGTSSFADIVKQQKNELEVQATSLASNFKRELSTLPLVQELSKKHEEEDKTRRKNNLILYGVPESESETSDARLKDDCTKVKKLFEEKIELTSSDIENVIRIGPRPSQKNSKRPLLVKCTTQDKKWEILKASQHLKYLENHESFIVYASIDRTKKEREEHKRLRVELQSRKENGEENLVIRNNRIVIKAPGIEPFQSRARNVWASLF